MGRIITELVYGVASTGIGGYTPSNHKEAYATWTNMLHRCYSEEFHQKNKSYIGCSVCDEWLNFQNFAAYYYGNKYKEAGWHLDKDIVLKDNKVYSPESCEFVPEVINRAFVKRRRYRGDTPIGVHFEQTRNRYKSSMHDGTGKTKFLGRFTSAEEAFNAYKYAKEQLIKSIALNYYGKISPRLFALLINYTIEITD